MHPLCVSGDEPHSGHYKNSTHENHENPQLERGDIMEVEVRINHIEFNFNVVKNALQKNFKLINDI